MRNPAGNSWDRSIQFTLKTGKLEKFHFAHVSILALVHLFYDGNLMLKEVAPDVNCCLPSQTGLSFYTDENITLYVNWWKQWQIKLRHKTGLNGTIHNGNGDIGPTVATIEFVAFNNWLALVKVTRSTMTKKEHHQLMFGTYLPCGLVEIALG